jgi:hypothetical protein
METRIARKTAEPVTFSKKFKVVYNCSVLLVVKLCGALLGVDAVPISFRT